MESSTEIRNLPIKSLHILSNILDDSQQLKYLLEVIPKTLDRDYYNCDVSPKNPRKYNLNHIRLNELKSKESRRKCTEILFGDWGTSGYIKAKHFKAADYVAIDLLNLERRRRPSNCPQAFISANQERTFIMIKPDGLQRGLVGKIITKFEQKGFKLVALKFMWPSEHLLKTPYADLSSKDFFPALVKYMSSGPIVPMVWEGLDVVKTARVLLGATNPADSAPGTIRGDLCAQDDRNICHGSDAVESAKKEIDLWFTEREVASWISPSHIC